MKNTQQGFINFWVILVILLIAGGGYVFLHRNDTNNLDIVDNITTNPYKNDIGSTMDQYKKDMGAIEDKLNNTHNQQTESTATADGPWVTYTDPEFGFSFDYPTKWGKLVTEAEMDHAVRQGVSSDFIRHEKKSRGDDLVEIMFAYANMSIDYTHTKDPVTEDFQYVAYTPDYTRDKVLMTMLGYKSITPHYPGMVTYVLDKNISNVIGVSWYYSILGALPVDSDTISKITNSVKFK